VGQPIIFFDEILNNTPEVEAGCRQLNASVIMKIGVNTFSEKNFLYVDSNFFKFYGWSLICGNLNEVLTRPYSVVISEKRAKEFFRNINPVGKSIKINNSDDYIITGIFKDIPEQSHFHSDFLVSFITVKKSFPDGYNSWGWHSSSLYFRLYPKTNVETINHKIAGIWNKKSQDYSCVGNYVKAKLQPFSEIYLKSGYLSNSSDNLFYVIAFAVIAGLVLIISCFNFVNLYIAVNLKGSTETGIKKVLGAGRKIFARQVLLEILTYLFVALIASCLLMEVLLPLFYNIINKELKFSLLNNLPLTAFLIILSSAILFVSGILPYLQLIHTNTAGAMKGIRVFSSKSLTKTITHGSLRNVLVVVQFTIGIMLILATIIVNKQLELIRNHNIGFDKEQVLVLDNSIGDVKARFTALKNILRQYPDIQSISSGSNVPSYGINNWGATSVAGNDEQAAPFCGFVGVNDRYFETIGAQLLYGRFFNENNASEKAKVIINESLMKVLGLKMPVGATLTGIWDVGDKEVIGVIKDIEYATIHYGGIPALFLYKPDNNNFRICQNMIIKLKSKNIANTVTVIKKDWEKLTPETPMDYSFLDQQFEANYRSETQTATLISIMTFVAVLLCCLGLFGLALFSINRRTKEIGVRKVNGAKTFEIIFLVNKEFVIWILTAFVIAVPISSYFLMKWLENFAVKATFPWWAVLLTGIIAMAIALLTVSWQTWRAASRNPVESLRYE
jgi:putative ABC transport system permease protein